MQIYFDKQLLFIIINIVRFNFNKTRLYMACKKVYLRTNKKKRSMGDASFLIPEKDKDSPLYKASSIHIRYLFSLQIRHAIRSNIHWYVLKIKEISKNTIHKMLMNLTC